ncbi:MAG: hypothetical protein ABI678_11830, partial [Kofleriaceae bacterium]
HPVVLVHGRGGHATDLAAITSTLLEQGYCVFGADYGQIAGEGSTGMNHLAASGHELASYVALVRAQTGAAAVDLVGYSEGTGVVNDLILAKAGGFQIRRLVSFGGLQHPYAHVGNNDLFLPNLIATARLVDPNITAQQVITTAIDLYAGVGGQLADVDREVAESPFASDLFDPAYWKGLHGALSEPAGVYIRLGTAGHHSVATHDQDPRICYTNLISPGDPITGQAAGYQDPAPNVDNVLLASTADHGQIISDPGALAKLVGALGSPCAVSPFDGGAPIDPGGGSDDPAGGGEDGSGPGGGSHAGCNAGGAGGLSAMLALLGLRRRRR